MAVGIKKYYTLNPKNWESSHVEELNTDLTKYIHFLHRKSHWFPRKLEIFRMVLYLFIRAYNEFLQT